MKKFFKNIAFFFLLMVVIGEITVRVTHEVSDIPQRTIDSQGIQKYFPNQVGFWKGRDHEWKINKFGWPGELPNSFDSLMIIIGDSYIENFMNPNECHQSVFLKQKMPDFNFMEAGRSGVSFIEALEISKQLDSLSPINTLIYVNDNDFYESVKEIEPLNDITQLSLDDNAVVHGEMKSPGIKKILYNWKLAYYLYNRFPINSPFGGAEAPEKKLKENYELKSSKEIIALLNYIKNHYTIANKTLVFHPGANKILIEECKKLNFKVIHLDSSLDKSWSFDHDTHWTCYGHERAALQVSQYLLKQNHKINYILGR